MPSLSRWSHERSSVAPAVLNRQSDFKVVERLTDGNSTVLSLDYTGTHRLYTLERVGYEWVCGQQVDAALAFGYAVKAYNQNYCHEAEQSGRPFSTPPHPRHMRHSVDHKPPQPGRPHARYRVGADACLRGLCRTTATKLNSPAGLSGERCHLRHEKTANSAAIIPGSCAATVSSPPSAKCSDSLSQPSPCRHGGSTKPPTAEASTLST